MVVAAGVWVFSIGIVVFTEAAEDCLVYDVGGKGAPPRTPPVALYQDIIIGIYEGQQSPRNSLYVNWTEGSGDGHDGGHSKEGVELEVQLETGGKKFVLRFRDHTLYLLQEATPTVDMGEANFPLYESRGKWQYLGVAVGGGWLTVTNPARAETVFQTNLGVDTSRCQLSVASSSRLALTYNCMAGCPLVKGSGSVVTARLPLMRSRSLYLQPDSSRYTVVLMVELLLEGLEEETLLLEVRSGLLRVNEWNRVDLTVERRRDEVEAWLEVNGEAGASDLVSGRLASATVSLEELTHGMLSTSCRPTRHNHGQASSGSTHPAGSCSWNLVWTLAGVSSLLLVLLLATSCFLCRRGSGQGGGASLTSPGLAMNSMRHPRFGDKTLSYHHYEEVEAVMKVARRPTNPQEDTGRPVKPREEVKEIAIPRENLPEEPLDLGIGQGLLASRIYENLSPNTRN